MKATKQPTPPTRLWVVFCDHSYVGVWPTRREAMAAAKLRQAQSIEGIEHYVAGPYVLARKERA